MKTGPRTHAGLRLHGSALAIGLAFAFEVMAADPTAPGAVWRLMPGYPQPDDAMKGYMARGDVSPRPGRMECRYFNSGLGQGQVAKAAWTFDEPPPTLRVGQLYTWTLTCESDEGDQAPGFPNRDKVSARMVVTGDRKSVV